MSKISFDLSEKQYKKWKEWRDSLPKENTGAIGGGDSFTFSPYGVGVGVKATYMDKYEIDLSDVDEW